VIFVRKLLIATDAFLPRWDGVVRTLTELIPGLAESFEITVIAPRFPGREPDLSKLPISLVRVPTMKLRISDFNPVMLGIRNYRMVRVAVRDAEVVFCQDIAPIGLMAILAGRGKRVVCYIHCIDWELATKALSLRSLFAKLSILLVKAVARFAYNRADLLIVPSREVGELLTWNGISTRKAVVHLGVDSSKFHPPESKAEAKRRIGLKEDVLTVGFMPRLGHEKDPLTLLRAFARVRQRFPTAQLLALGDGETDIIGKFASQRGVWLLGAQDDVVPYLQAMDVYVLPSLTETTSLSTLEAMACGCAVVCTPVGYVREYIEDNVNGMLFPPGNVYQLSKKLAELFEDPYLREALGRAARRTVVERFSWVATLTQVRQLLRGGEHEESDP